MSYYRRSRKDAKNLSIIGYLIILVCCCLIITMAYFFIDGKKNRIELDPVTNCPKDIDSVSSYVAVIFDKTDTYNRIQQTYLKRYFSDFRKNLSLHSKISFYVITDNDDADAEIRPEYSICNPATGTNADSRYQNEKRMKKNWQTKFEQPLKNAITSYLTPSAANSSPIFEIFQKVALTAFPSDKKAKKKIIIISDMLHHTDEWSHYDRPLDFDAFSKTPYSKKVSTDLQGASVEILYISREGSENIQTTKHQLFWESYIRENNGVFKKPEYVDG